MGNFRLASHDGRPSRRAKSRPAAAVRGEPRQVTAPPTQILSVATEWFPSHGGLSALNRYLCIALARTGARVYCLVPEPSAQELADAAAADVTLVPAQPAGSPRESLVRKPILPDAVEPDIIIGHGRVTGPMAKWHVEDHYSDARYLHIVHAEPDEIEWYKLDRDDDVAESAEERVRMELTLAQGATRTLAVGPKLYQWIERDLRSGASAPALRLDPGFDNPASGHQEPPPGVPQIMVMGRMSDIAVKGLDIAAQAVGHAIGLRRPDAGTVDLLIRGTRAQQGAGLRTMVRDLVNQPTVRVVPRNFSTTFEYVRDDLARSSLLLMPSRAEGFGLAGLEAIAAGTPVLVSDRSGLGMLLCEVLPRELSDQVVVPVADDPERDVPLWGHATATVLRNRAAAFQTAKVIREIMARRRTWAMAAELVLSVAQRQSRPGQQS